MKKLLLAAAATCAMLSAAQAADIIEPTAYDWTGPYIGLAMAGVTTTSKWTEKKS
jgi:outer membrane immunogenic protein